MADDGNDDDLTWI